MWSAENQTNLKVALNILGRFLLSYSDSCFLLFCDSGGFPTPTLVLAVQSCCITLLNYINHSNCIFNLWVMAFMNTPLSLDFCFCCVHRKISLVQIPITCNSTLNIFCLAVIIWHHTLVSFLVWTEKLLVALRLVRTQRDNSPAVQSRKKLVIFHLGLQMKQTPSQTNHHYKMYLKTIKLNIITVKQKKYESFHFYWVM